MIKMIDREKEKWIKIIDRGKAKNPFTGLKGWKLKRIFLIGNSIEDLDLWFGLVRDDEDEKEKT